MKLNDIFTQEQYEAAYSYVKESGFLYTIIEIAPTESGKRQFQIVEIPQPSQEELNKREIGELKEYLANTDYVVIKIAEGVSTAEDYAEVLIRRAEARGRINELE